MSSRFARSVVRLYGERQSARGSSRSIQGAGFLVDDRHIVTCEHVVRQCVTDGNDEVELDFPFIPGEKTILRARVDFAHKNENTDVAGLTLLGPPPKAAVPSTLVRPANYVDHRWRAPGFPRNSDTGEYAEGTFLDVDARQWIMLKSDSGLGRRVQKGYSGGPVFDRNLHAVTGMIVAADNLPDERVAFMIPIGALVDSWSSVLNPRLREPNPYQGLNSFDESTADAFFGREATTEALADALRSIPLLVLSGDSGLGKSSTVRAGLVPEMRRRGWRVLMVPGLAADPFGAVASSIIGEQDSPADEPFSTRVAGLATILQKSGFAADTRHALKATAGEPVLLVIDQLEELFTLCTDEKVRRKFVAGLCESVELRRTARFSVVLCLRQDHLYRLRDCFDYRAGKHQEVELTALEPAELRRAIEEPALRSGVTFEPGLVDRILQDVAGQPAALPSMEFVLASLWDQQHDGQLRHRPYAELGGVRGAVAQRAECLLAELEPAQQISMKRVFIQLVALGRDDRGMRRPVTERDLLPGDWQTIEMLADERLVVTGIDGNARRTARIAHESLVIAWPTLQRWVDATAARLESLDRKADKVIRRYSTGAIVAGPFGSLVVLIPAWTRMGMAIGEVYDITLDAATIKTMMKATARTFGGYLGGSVAVAGAVLAVRVALPPVALALATAQSAFASAATTAAGQAWKEYFRLRHLGAAEPDIEDLARSAGAQLGKSAIPRGRRRRAAK